MSATSNNAVSSEVYGIFQTQWKRRTARENV